MKIRKKAVKIGCYPFLKKLVNKNSCNTTYQFWQQNNQPIEIFSNAFITQKLTYLHENPVKAGIVQFAADYIYSSAAIYVGKGGLIEVDLLY